MKSVTLVNPTKERNGIIVKNCSGNINSCELRKVSISGRDNGYIASINESGAIVISGTSWRGKSVNTPVPFDELEVIVRERSNDIQNIINQ